MATCVFKGGEKKKKKAGRFSKIFKHKRVQLLESRHIGLMQGKVPCLGQDQTLHNCKRLSPLPCMTAVTLWGHHRVSGSLPQHRRGGCCPRSVVPVCSRCRGNISTVIPLWLWCRHRYMLLSSPQFHPERHYLVGGDLNMLESRCKNTDLISRYKSCIPPHSRCSTCSTNGETENSAWKDFW